MQDYWERIGMSESRKTHLDKYKIIMICTLSVVSQPVLVENPTVYNLQKGDIKERRNPIYNT